MEENVRSLLAQECFYFRTSLNWAVENELTLDKCLLVMVERRPPAADGRARYSFR